MKIAAMALLAVVGLAACGNSQNKPLPMVKASDPVAQLNPDQWGTQVNDLMPPPGAGSPRPMQPSDLVAAGAGL